MGLQSAVEVPDGGNQQEQRTIIKDVEGRWSLAGRDKRAETAGRRAEGGNKLPQRIVVKIVGRQHCVSRGNRSAEARKHGPENAAAVVCKERAGLKRT